MESKDEAEIKERDEAAKAVLKAAYEQKKIEIGDTKDNTGKAAAAGAAAGGNTTAGKGAKLEHADYQQKTIDIADTKDNTGKAAAAGAAAGGNTTAGKGAKLEHADYQQKTITIAETKDNTGVAAAAGVEAGGHTTVGEGATLTHVDYDAKVLATTDSKGNAGIAAAAGVAAGGATTAGKGATLAHVDYHGKNIDIDATVEKKGGKAKASAHVSVHATIGGTQSGGTSGARWHDHQGGFRFELEFGSLKAGGFRSVDGLGVSTELIEYQSGKDKYARQIPGRPKIAPVVLKKGYVNTSVLWDWMKSTMDGKMKFENVSVILMDDSGQDELARYDLLDTWPSRWSGWQLDANGSNAMVEELELQVRHINRVAGKK